MERGGSSSSTEAPSASGAEPLGADHATHAADTFSPLLWIPHVQHRVALASTEDETMLTVRHRTSGIPYVGHPLMEQCIMNLGLYQLATMPQGQIDQALMSGLAERWRPETHSFHLPFGEMTVTLADVSALWGLRIDGEPISGVSDSPLHVGMIRRLLGVADPKTLQKKKKKKDDEEFRYSGYCISLAALRDHFFLHRITAETTDLEAVRRYVRAFVLDLCGSVMFVDSSGDAVPIMFLSLLTEIEKASNWNWGGAVIAYLYRSLCHACLVKNKQIHGPLLLLQQWSWSHLPVCRPVRPSLVPYLRRQDAERCPAYGAIWGDRHTYENTGRGRTVGISYVRSQLQMLHESSVDWFPYREFYERNAFCRLTLEQRHWTGSVD